MRSQEVTDEPYMQLWEAQLKQQSNKPKDISKAILMLNFSKKISHSYISTAYITSPYAMVTRCDLWMVWVLLLLQTAYLDTHK